MVGSEGVMGCNTFCFYTINSLWKVKHQSFTLFVIKNVVDLWLKSILWGLQNEQFPMSNY